MKSRCSLALVLLGKLPEGMPVTYQAGGTLWLKEYFYKRYGLAFALTSTLIEDGDHIRIGSVIPASRAVLD